MVARPSLNSIPLGLAVDQFCATMDRAAASRSSKPTQSTVETYRRNLTDLVTLIGEDALTDSVTPQQLEDANYRYAWLADRRRAEYRDDPLAKAPTDKTRKSAWSQATFWRSANRFFEYAAQQGWVQVSPATLVTSKPSVGHRTPKRPEREALDVTEARALMKYGPGPEPAADAKGSRAQRARYVWLRNRALLTLLIVTGPRVSEVCNADRQDFTGLRSDQVWWRIVGKGDAERRIPISRDVMQLILDSWEAAPEPANGAERAAFLTVRGNRLVSRDVQYLLESAYQQVRAQDRLAARRVTPHGLRHTAATLLAAAGWELRLIAKMLGHANLATLSVYLDSRAEELVPMMVDHPATRERRARGASSNADELRVLPSPTSASAAGFDVERGDR